MRRITRIWIVLLTVSLVTLARRPPTGPERTLEPPRAAPVIVLTGDILLAGRVGDLIEREGPQAPLRGVREVLRGADLAIGNLECPIAAGGEPARKQFTFRARPEAVEVLSQAGYDLVTLANNHAMDYGPEGLLETLSILREHGLLAVGAGRDREEARRFLVVERGSPPWKIAVLAFSNMLPTSFYAGARRPGTNPARPEQVRQEVAAARAQADLVIVLFHWGEELSPTPSDSQRSLARAAVEAGADLVVGHHPHVLQGLEQRGHALIAYSLGNFLFPSRGAASHSVMLRYRPGWDGSARAELIPCVIEGFRPRVASGSAGDEILGEMHDLSQPLGVNVSRDGGVDLPANPCGRSRARPRSVDKAGGRP